MKKYTEIPGVTRARCAVCKRRILIVQPTVQVQLGIPPDTKNARCENCADNWDYWGD